MSDIGSSFIGGFNAVQGYKERKQRKELETERRKQLEAEARLDRGLRLDLQARQFAADAERQFADHSFRGNQGWEDRNWRTGERVGSQGFIATESAADRALRGDIVQKQLDAAAREFAGAQAARARAQNWAESPLNPLNAYSNPRSGSLMPPDLSGADAPAPLGRVDQPMVDWARRRLADEPQDARARRILQANGLGE